MKKIFITGGSGFIGTALITPLYKLGYTWRTFDIKDNPLNDVRNYDSLRAAIFEYEPTHIIHLGMTSKVTDGNKFPHNTKESILGGTMNVLEVIKEYHKLERFVFASSSTVYGDFVPTLTPPTEKHPTNPLNIYGALKLSSEVLIKAYSKMYGIDYTIVRPSSVYGPLDMNMRVIGRFLYDAMTRGVIDVYGDDLRVDFSYIDDVADGIIRATFSDKAANETFNITRGQTRTLLEAAELVNQLVPSAKIILYDKNSLFPKRGAFDVSKAKILIGYNPKVDLPEGIKMYYEHMALCLGDYE